MMGSQNSGDIRIENGDRHVNSFVEFSPLVFDKKAAKLKSTPLVSYSNHPNLLNVLDREK